MSPSEAGKCPGCDSAGKIGVACTERTCVRLGFHYIPDQWWEKQEGVEADPMVGQMVGDFLVVAPVGAGGFGRVFLALQAPLFRLKGALKLLELPSRNAVVVEAMLQKFQQEAEALAELTHPNIVRLLKYGIHRERPYLVMEYIEGGCTLRDEIWQRAQAGRSFSHQELLDLLGQVLNALEAAHERSIIHRDIKPENIMIQPVAGHPNHLKILDFGTAKFTEGQADTKWPLGSPSYMAPEQIEMKGIGPWSDLFAVGVLTFELMAGRKPFPGDSENSIVSKKLDLDYDPMAQLDGLDFPQTTVAFLRRALAIDTEARFRDVESFRAGLRNALEALGEKSTVIGQDGVELTSLLDSRDMVQVSEDELPTRKAQALVPTPPPIPDSDGRRRSPVLAFVGLSLVAGLATFAVLNFMGQAESDAEKTAARVDAEPPPKLEFPPETVAVVEAEDVGYAVDAYAWDAGIDFGPDVAGPLLGRISAVTAGKFHSCISLRDGRIRCWGANFDGELGLGHDRTIGDDEPLSDAPWITFEDPVVQLESAGDRGSSFNCALSMSGAVRCWGSNSFGQLGLGHTKSIGTHRQIGGPGHGAVQLGQKAIDIAVGGAQYASHACALLEDGTIRCWGGNKFGQLGLGHTRNIGDNETPLKADVVDVGGTAIDVVAGKHHTCALLEDGTVRCWGYNREGQLGYGHTDNIGDDETPASAGPVDVGGKVVSLAAGRGHTCAVLEEGRLRCWGWNNLSQLGLGHRDNIGDDEAPSSVEEVNVGGTVKTAVAGSNHTCAVLDDGNVKCWGDNRFGQLGYGHENPVSLPATVGAVYLGGPALALYAGSYHNCAILPDDVLRCWGFNKFGQLGLGHTDDVGDDEPPGSVTAPVFEAVPE